MQSAEKSRSGWLCPAALPALALLLLAGCASSAAKPLEEGGGAAPALSAPPAPEAAEATPAPTATTIVGAAPGEAQASAVDPLLSEARRLAPAGTGLLVLGLPEPSLPPAEAPPPPTEAALPAAAAMAAPEPAPPEPASEPAPGPGPGSALPGEAPALASLPAQQPAPAPAGSGLASPAAAAPASIKPPPAPQSPPAPRPAPAPQASAPKLTPAVQPAPAPKALPPESPAPASAQARAPLALLPFVDPNGAPAAPRRFAVELGQGLEIPFSGTGWTYLGEKNGREGLRYVSRRFSEGGVLFSLLTTAPGEFSLAFQRQDLLKGQSLEEFVTVLVQPKLEPALGAAPALAGPGPAPSAPASAAPSAGATAAIAGAAAGAAGAAPAPTAPASAAPPAGATATIAGAAPAAGAAAPPSPSLPDSPEELLRLARTEFGAGHAAETLAALERFLVLYPIGMDEVYLLLGRARELNSPYRDVKKAYEAYKKLSEDYPQSQFWNEAVERLAYIERHYFEIR